jgi:hypothetical protein
VNPKRGAAASYSLVLPPGWVRVPLREGTAEALEEKVFRGVEKVPAGVARDDGMAYRLYVRRRVEKLVGEARKAGGLDLYVPVGVRARGAIAASFVVGEVAVRGEGSAPAEAVVARLAGDAGEVRGVGDTVAARWEYVRGPSAAEAEVDTASRHVDYVLPVPGDEGRRWLAVSFSTAGDGDPGSAFTRALAELFDAVMTTFQWSRTEIRTTADA